MSTLPPLDAKQRASHDTYGFWVGPGPGPGPRDWIYIPRGSDPRDGMPLTAARQCSLDEEVLWSRGELAELARVLARGGAPVKMPPAEPVAGWWDRVWERIARGCRRR